jgi:diguanylate cyclase (GGDEF)-like protein
MEAIHRYQASHDGLTGLLSRESFIAQCDQLIERCQQHNQPCSLSYIDLDRFKAINDTYGHAGGDEVLRHFAKTMKKVMRKTDTAGRLGGEEFAIFFPDASLEDSKLILDRLRQEIEHSEVNYHAEVIQYTLSAGLTTAKPPSEATENSTADHFETMAKKADSALYQAKDSGRNTIICVI